MTFIQGMRSASVASDFDGPEPMTWLQDSPEQLAMRQLRHHTKNALQRLLCQIASCPGLQRDPAGRALAHDLERRIRTSAILSDALFGLTQAPSSLEVRLMTIGRGAVEMMADGDQEIDVTVSIDGLCPPGYDDVLVRVAHELICNAVKHGMHLRLVGKIDVSVDAGKEGVTLCVTDDGWGPCLQEVRGEVRREDFRRGDGLRIATLLAEQHGGTLRLSRDRCRTIAQMTLPPRGLIRGVGQ
jgi:two-component sensor histidine kinase